MEAGGDWKQKAPGFETRRFLKNQQTAYFPLRSTALGISMSAGIRKVTN